MIPEELVEEVRLRADLVEVVSEHTRLKRSGRTFRGPCPLHGGEGPNFSVDPAKGFYKCFVCGEGGTVFTFLMKHLGMTYPEAIRDVAQRVGIEIPDARAPRPEEDPNRHLHDANSFAADWFRRNLREGDGARDARAYLARRGITDEAMERFRMGWAPEEWSALREAARAQNIGDDVLLQLGLVKESRSGRDPYDAFRGRIIFPIEDLGGRVVAFGGRILGEAEEHVPKYLNSPESPVYHKGRMLYGLGWSRGAIRKAETALVVEGYMDYVSLAAHGVDNAVAPLGTAMTEEQAELLAKYAPRVILLYDSDKAGLKATFRTGDELLRAGTEVLVATLPEGEDPDSLVRAKGAKALQKYLDDAVDVLERKIQILERRGFFATIAGTRKALDALLPTVRAATDELLRGVYVARIAEKTGIPRDTLEREIAEAPPRDTRPPGAPDRRKRNEGRRADDFTVPREKQVEYPIGAERNLLLLLLRDESYVERAARTVHPEDFRDPAYRSVYQWLLQTEGQRGENAEWFEQLQPEARPVAERLLGDEEAREVSDPEEFFSRSVGDIASRAVEEHLTRIRDELAVAPPERQMELLKEMQELRKRVENPISPWKRVTKVQYPRNG